MLETARITSIVLQIYCPEKSAQVLDILGVSKDERMVSDAKLKDEQEYFDFDGDVVKQLRTVMKSIRI